MPTETLTLYTNPMSRGRIARWMLEETGVPYVVENLDYQSGMKSPEYLAMNPMGKVPVLRHGSRIVTESAAICAYLADAFPECGLAPAPADRHEYYRWLFFAAGPLEAAVTNRALGVTVPVDQQGMVGYGNLERVIDTLEQACQRHEYIAGDLFSAADVYVGAQIGWGLHFGTIDRRPAFESYWSRLSVRDACKRAHELDDAARPKSA